MPDIDLMDGDEYGIPIHKIPKGRRKEIRISINEFKGHQYIDVREFYLDGDLFKPSPRGVTLKKELYHELLEAVVALGEALGLDRDDTGEQPADDGAER